MRCIVNREELKEKASKDKNRKIKKYVAVGAATVGGGVLLGKNAASPY